MCGILAYASTRPHPDPRSLASQRDVLQHRGPDDAGLWWSEDARVVLAHRRLSIIDLSAAGRQPLAYADSGVRVILNGEIYNYRELRSELKALGHHFATETDTEVLAAAYAQWSRSVVERLVGMFAFVLHDERNGIVFAARDRAGEKPLYYWRDGAAHWFASELKALLRDPRAPRRLNYSALDHYLAYGYVPGDEVLIKGISKVPPAHAVELDVTHGTARSWRYWSLPEAQTAQHSVDSAVDELEKKLETAVRSQLVADVPVGIMLSGGMDSSLITALATRVAGPPRTFTVSFPGAGEYDEAAHARMIADHFHTEHYELIAEPASIQLLPVLAEQFDEPIADPSILPTHLVAKLIREHAKVALGGNGGDELFGGYRTYQWMLRQQQLRGALPGPVRRLGGELAAALPAGFRGRNYLRGLDHDRPRAVANVNLYFDSALRSRLVPRLAAHEHPSPEERKASLWSGHSLVQQLTRTDFVSYLAESILLKEDRASMLNSLEVRSPFLDPGVIDFAFSLPDDLRVTTRARKILLRELASRILPPQFDRSRKQGFSVPVDRWLKDDWGSFFRAILLSDNAPLFDQRTVTRLLDTRAPAVVHGNRLFSLTFLELWRRAYSISI
jgi:asparagine synthase (glutamine-hydrolysing)